MEETLKLILTEMKDLKKGMTGLQEDVSGLKVDVSILKNDVSTLKYDVAGLKDDVSELKEGQDRIESKLEGLSSELRSNFKFTNGKIDEHRNVFGIVSEDIKGVKVDIEYLSSKTGIHDTELNNIMSKLRG
ncbi:hypothetical protein [Bacillus sp. PS06]|uniref:hypothetical protein n=1 Tax=Bacillus sp. PS06 TaxID=2764176 RepID=UPI00177FC8BE|nr:hypothetical protein [Bacillus sp. PS06]MBD8071414.1 hypothetical protein [Bacillus sp. PS06]